MTVCKFFQQGYCRFGQNCRYDHIYGSKYSYHANSQPQAPAPQASGLTDHQLLNQVRSDVQAALHSGQWILSCYSPFTENPNFPGIPDLSPEEARLFIYEAKANNNLDQAVSYINNLLKETRQKYEQLLQPNANIIKVLKSLYKGETVSSPFSITPNSLNNATGTGNTASSIFRSAIQTSPFNQTPAQNMAQSIFNQANSNFNSQSQDPAKNLFSTANTNIFNTNQNASSPFATQNSAKSIFASAAQNAFNTTNQTSPSNILSTAQSMFVNECSQNTSPFNIKDNQMSGFGQPNVTQQEDPGVYRKMEDLVEDDLEAFKSESFQLGFIPEMPPPYSLC